MTSRGFKKQMNKVKKLIQKLDDKFSNKDKFSKEI
jgi:hypothetical protein